MKICILLAIVLVAVRLQSDPPTPHCTSRPIFTTLPMTVGEIINADLSNSFTGYNLEMTIKKGGDVAQTVKKLDMLGELNYPVRGLQSHFVEHTGNDWGDYAHVLTDDFGQTMLHLYSIKNKTGAPELIQSFLVEYQANTYCFDAVVYLDHGLAIVDCAEQSRNSSNFLGVKNKFIYLDLVTGGVRKEVYNELYESFSWVSRRKFSRYHDPHTGYEYIIRAHFVSGVDLAHAGNTYLEFFSAYDIEDLQVMRVVDRVYLGIKELAITDFKIYLGDIFLLDYFRGIFRLDITHGQHIVITGRYEGEFFTRFSVYSDDLDEQVLLALANQHAVYEVNMDRPSTPILVAKYSLMQHSMVHNIIIDEKYLVVQASANASTGENTTTMLNYTWVFSKNSRTYLNAFKVIDHNSTDVLIDMNRYKEELMIFDQKGIRHYKLNDPIITLQQRNESTVGQAIDIVIEAVSTDPVNGKVVASCLEQTTVQVVRKDNMTIWPTGIAVPETYYVNYPGRLEVFLSPYVVGPNITFSVMETMIHHDLPRHWIDQQNQSFVNMDGIPIIGNINFFYTEVVPNYGNETVIYYFQDIRNVTTVSFCVHLWEDIHMNCTTRASYQHTGRIKTFTTAWFELDGIFKYYYLWTLENIPNTIYVVDFIKHQYVGTIQLPDGYEGYVGSMSTTNGILFVTLPYMKTINAYHLNRCPSFPCPMAFSIDSKALKPLGIDYFAPLQLVTSRWHPEVLFIKCLGSVIILDVDNRDRLILLDELYSHAILKYDYKLAVNQRILVVVAAPDVIEEYSIENIYANRQVKYLKSLYLYNYTIPTDFDIEFSDVGDLFYINTVDGATNLTTVLIFRTGAFSVSSLYDVINMPGLYSHKNLEIEVSGYFVDFVSIIASGAFYVYKQFEIPFLVLEDGMDDYQFYLHFTNHETSQNISLVSVKVANYPEDFKPTSEFEKIRNSLKAEKGQYTFDTRKWFTGHILRYNYSCPDCHHGVRLVSHINTTGLLRIGGSDYAETFFGGMALWEDIFRLRINGSIYQILLLPDPKAGERCFKLTSTFDDLVTVTGCRVAGQGTHLYITSQAGHRGFTWGPFLTGARNSQNLQMVNELLIVVDVDEYPQFRIRNGGVFVYALNLDPISEIEMDELDYIDSNDFSAAHGWDRDDAYIGNAHLMYDGYDNTYRLYVTEITSGLFVLDFAHKFGSRELEIITMNYVDLNKILQANGFHMPNDAIFLTVTHTSFIYNQYLEMQNILVTTTNFHSFEFTLIYDSNGHIISTILHRVYYRYGYYTTRNYVRAANGYMAISYIIPPLVEYMSNYSRQVVALYDTMDYPHESEKGYSERYMLGAHTFNHTDQCAFGFNTTYDFRTNGTRMGLVIIDGVSNRMWESSISRNLSFEITADIPEQKVKITPYSDFGVYSFDIDVIPKPGPGPGPEPDKGMEAWRIILIVLGSVIASGFVAYIIFLCYKRSKRDPEENPLERGLNDEEDGSTDRVGALNESVAYTESARHTLNLPTPDSVPAVSEQENQPSPADGAGLAEPAVVAPQVVPVRHVEVPVVVEDRAVPPPPAVDAPAVVNVVPEPVPEPPAAEPAPPAEPPAPPVEPAA